jgi:NAD(P)-dependent dehydrogenase (short-subunit alcohol dehydrogenase family)
MASRLGPQGVRLYQPDPRDLRGDESARPRRHRQRYRAAGERFDANYICGSAGNAAIMAFTRALGGKSLADNIRVVGINPGPVGTDRHITLLKTRAKNQFGDESRYTEFQKGLPLGRPAHAREIGDLMAFLASDRSGYTSGVIYTVDGGLSAGWG